MSPVATVEQPQVAAPDLPHAEPSVKRERKDEKTTGEQASWQVELLLLDEIAPCPYQPRILFDLAEMAELAASVKAHGVQQPVLVRPFLVRPCKPDANPPKNGKANGVKPNGSHSNGPKPNGSKSAGTKPPRYELVAGERRLRASRDAGRKTVPAIVREMDDRTAAEIALTENVQRSNLSAIEEARGYKQLMLRFRMSEERIAKKVGKSVATIQNTMKLLALPAEVQEMLAKRQLTASHGHALLPLAAQPKVCLSVAQHAWANALTATSLSQNALPNVQELKRKGLVQELDFRSKFDYKAECAKCPHKAYVQSGYASYCLRPEEWHVKQSAAVERAKDEAAQAMQRVREDVQQQEQQAGTVNVQQLPSGSFRSLAHVELPAGCGEQCPCRKQVQDPHDQNKTVPVCLDPQRFKALQQAERQAQEEARRRRYKALFQRGLSVLQDERERQEPRKTAVLLCSLVLRMTGRYGAHDTNENLSRGVAHELGIALPWSELLDARDDATVCSLLEGTLAVEDGTDGERETLATGQAIYAPDSNQLLGFAAALLLANEAQHGVSWGGETPQLAFVLGSDHDAQVELEMGSADVSNAPVSIAFAASELHNGEDDETDEDSLDENAFEEDVFADKNGSEEWPDNQSDDSLGPDDFEE